MQCFFIALVAMGVAAEATDSTQKAEQPVVESKASAPSLQLMSAKKEARLRALLPRVADAEMRKVLSDPNLILYTDDEIPRAYQFWSGDLPGVHLANYNISANGSEPFGNGNREFPWGHPAGTHRTTGVEAFRFLSLPKDKDGKIQPVVWFRKRLPGDGTMGYAWTYPVGTVVGEVLAMTGPDGLAYTFEMRVRTREYGYWDVDVFRPFPTASALSRRIKELRPDWEQDENLVKVVNHLDSPVEMKSLRLVDSQPAKRTFDQTMGIDSLPAIGDTKLVGQLLTSTPFKSSMGEVWRESSSGVKTYAPTTKAEFHVIPAKYDAGFVQVDRTSCMRCHDSVAHNVSEFNPGRDWYGNIRGSDAIFSFHPFALESIADNGFGRAVRMRPEFEKAGIVAKYDPDKHPGSVYHSLDK